MLIQLFSALVGLIAVAVGPEEFRAPPSEPPAYTEQRPEPAADGYVSRTDSIVIDVARSDFVRWVNDPDLELSDLVQGDEDSPRVVATENLRGAWDPDIGRAGDRRRVEFADGHYLAEEVLEDSPNSFRYMIWGFTDPRQRHAIDHAIAAFEFAERGDVTEVIWTYSFQPTVWPLRPLVATFVDSTMSALMRETLVGMKEGAETAIGARSDG